MLSHITAEVRERGEVHLLRYLHNGKGGVFIEEYIAKTEKSLDQWARLIRKYPDRFMIGTDVVGHWTQYKVNIEKYYVLLDRLPKEVAQNLSYGNILRLCHLTI